MQLSLPKQLLIAVCLVHLFINVIWLAQNFAPLPWDQAGHTRIAIRMSQYFQGQLPPEENAHILTISNYYPPLIHIITAQFITLLGKNVFVASLPVTLFFLLMIVGIYKLNTTLYTNEWIGVISATVFSLIPVIYENSRWFLLEIPMLTFLVFALAMLKKTEGFSNWKYTFLFSLMTGLLLLTKWIGAVFLLVPVLFTLYQAKKDGKDLQLIVTNSLIGLFFVFLLSIPWYSQNLFNLVTTGSMAIQGEESDPQQLLSLQNIFYYLHHFVNFQVTVWPALGLIITATAYFAIHKAPYKALFATSLLTYYLFFTLISNKDIRYTLPLLLIMVSMAGYVAYYLYEKKKTIQLVILSLLAIPLVLYYFLLSFGLGPKYQGAWSLEPIGWIDYINTTEVVVHHPKPDRTPVKLILADIDRQRNGEHVYAYIGVDQAEVNPSTFDLYQSLGNYTKVSLPKLAFNQNRFETEEEMLAFMAQYQFYVLPDASVGTPASRNKTAMEQIRDYILRQHLSEYIILREYASPGPEGKMLLIIPNEK